MKNNLAFRAAAKMLAGLILVGLPLFLSAGTLSFPGAWRLLIALFACVLAMGAVLLLKSPDLLEKRLSNREKEDTQKRVVALSGLMFVLGFVAAGLDFRYCWAQLPGWLSWTATAIFLLGYAMFAEVTRENAWLSRTIEVHEGQQVVDTGLYGVVRHPMYTATLLMFLAMPVVLGSLVSLVLFLPYPVLIAARIKNEEEVLERELRGYTDYKRRVKYRMIPFVW